MMGTGKLIARRTNFKLWPGQRRAAQQLNRGSDADADADANTDADADADADAEGLSKIEEQHIFL